MFSCQFLCSLLKSRKVLVSQGKSVLYEDLDVMLFVNFESH